MQQVRKWLFLHGLAGSRADVMSTGLFYEASLPRIIAYTEYDGYIYKGHYPRS